ncbi:elongation of very long chain fatty acids protein 6-like [Solea senegalensis]|uniref:Elongation of very long chain fatty acids protein 6 n=1 Tax=Solea senegalensis TaxID=28829 RepID=A0AAV6RUU0_SOLSE|nr:elongation of very long chain fatty acids protein 6-like [Solea senegalensis]KAG7507827.1 elongation of very long chain fatty acids protein 6-like [Solea senegalensis]
MNGSAPRLSLAEYDFERRFDVRSALEWMQENWSKSFMFCGLYAVFVFAGQHFMRERPKLNLRRPLVLWSLSLAIFSIIGAFRTVHFMAHVLSTSGFKRSVCDSSFYSGPVTKFWAYAFALSKAPELGDTVFIILRKQRLIFLHWYHHITVLVYSWYSYKDKVAGGGWFMTMNYMVHSLMYTYYAARAAGLRVPRICAMIITATQILQMVMGLAVLGLVYHWLHEVHCPSNMDNITWGVIMYLSYLILFAIFFYNSYLKDSSGVKGSSEVKKSKAE